jgi:hypothetical protein
LVAFILLWPNKQELARDSEPAQLAEGSKPPQPYLVSVSVTGAQKEVSTNESLRIRLRGKYSDGSENELSEGVEWNSSEPRVAAVDAQGRVTALQAGTTKISGRYGKLQSDPWELAVAAVEPPAVRPEVKLLALQINPSKKELMPKEKISLKLKGNYSDGSEKAFSRGVTWRSSEPTIASINSKGELEAIRAGQVTVTARADRVTSAPAEIVIRPPMVVIPSEASAQKAYGTPQIAIPSSAEQLRSKIVPYMNRAKDYRVQGNYTAALAELDKAQGIDPSNAEIRKEIDQTKRACNAEKRLGRKELEC